MATRLLVVLWLFCGAVSANPEIDKLFSSYDKPNVPGASVVVIREGEPIFMRAYGLQSLDPSEPTSTRTNYRLASVSKQFTALAIAQLIERGELSLDTTLTEIFPDFPAYGKSIKVDHLLHHTSGLRSYEEHIPSGMGQLSDADVLKILKGLSSTQFTPGSRYSYSNSGYCVLSNIVAKVSGKSFPEFLAENIFIPLGMDNSIAYVKGGPEIPTRAYGYTASGGGFNKTDQSQTSATLGDGGVYTSVSELVLWDRALYGTELASADTMKRIFEKGKLNNGSSVAYGYGWVIDTYSGELRHSHTGSTIGFRTSIQRFPNKKLTIIVLVNRANASPWDTASRIADLYL